MKFTKKEESEQSILQVYYKYITDRKGRWKR